jgi:hypothetical protein
MNGKKLLKLSLYTLPVSIFIFFVMDWLISSIAGGLGSMRGFPIPYYRDIWETPNIEFNQPGIIAIDVLIIYALITLVVYQVNRDKNKQ